eukprot:GEMP01033135.1.p1 GENE.GEMP01033135.1~~GEMP01033135.1.p1  ORF type:complete len:352 (+),score=91.97 GEMP01033135.1:52-1107(+)
MFRLFLMALGASAKVTLEKSMDAVVFSKKNPVSIIGFFKDRDQGKPFEKLEKEFGKLVAFAQSTSREMLERYELTFDDLPCAILLRNFNEEGKDIGNRREIVVAAMDKGTIGKWDQKELKKFLVLEGVPPIIMPDQGPDYQARLELLQKSDLPKMFYYFNGKEQKKNLQSAFKVDEDEGMPVEFSKKVVVIALEWSGDKDGKDRMRSISGFKGKIKTPMLVQNTLALGDVKKPNGIKQVLRKALRLSAPKKKEKKEEKPAKEPTKSLKQLVDEWNASKFDKDEAVKTEDFLAAKAHYQKETGLHKKITMEVGEHTDLLERSEDELRAELETGTPWRKTIVKKLLGMDRDDL